MTDTTPTEATEAEMATATTEPTEGTPDAEAPAADEAQADSGDQGDAEADDRPGRDAAKYRRRLRDTEAERDQLATRLTAMQTAEVERLAATHITKGSALWAGGVTLADLLDDAGTVDPERVKAAALSARDTLGLTKPPAGNHVPREGGNPTVTASSSSMVDVVMGRNR